MTTAINRLRDGIIISCQAAPEDPTFGPAFMVAFALAAQRGGAVGIRANSAEDVAAIKQATGLPVIGIWKRPGLDGQGIMITPSVADAVALRDAGADMIAADADDRPRPGGIDASALIRGIVAETGLPFMADCATLEQAQRAQDAGASLAATTRAHSGPYAPDLALLEAMVTTLAIPVIAEGGYWNPDDVRRAFEIGALAVVIGSAVTRPWLITERYVKASPNA